MRPDGAAVEEVFVNANPQSTLKLGQARGVVCCAAARAGLEVGEYAARLVKKAVVGVGNAEKAQVHAMVARLLPGVKIDGADAADALAVAICHAHHLASARRIAALASKRARPLSARPIAFPTRPRSAYVPSMHRRPIAMRLVPGRWRPLRSRCARAVNFLNFARCRAGAHRQ